MRSASRQQLLARFCWLVISLAMSLGLPRTVLGQSGPYIDMWPEGSFQSPNLEVTIIVCDDSGLSTYRRVQLNGATVSSAFGPWPQSSCAMLTGTVQLQPGTNSIFAEFQNTQGYYAGAWIYPVYTPPQVAVTPKNGVLTTPASSPSIAQFVITNPGASNTRYNLVPQCSPAAINCAAPAHVTVMPGQSEPVNVTFTSGAAGTSASVQLQATVHGVPSVTDAGSINVTTTPLVSRPFVERGLCLTIAAGPDAAYECGNLRIAHALPSVRTVNTVRAPTLLYNSEHAHPYPLVHANVTMPPGEALPTTVRATLMVNGVQKPVQDWPGSQWGAAGNTRRIAVGFDALADSTGVYPYQLEIRRITGGSSTVLQIDTGSVPIVNRKDSPFGAGWWLAGYEELRFLANNRVLWVGGDGSVRTYDSVGTTATHRIYLAAQVTRQDTLLRQISNGTWSRQLRDGGRVVFTAAGKHAQTVNRLSSFVTTFTLNGSGNLWKITVPPAAAALVYEFTYTGSGSSAKLATITVPDSAVGTVRTTGFTIDGSKRVTAITDPGSPAVTFTYDPTITRRIATRTDRRGTLTRYRFDAARRLASSALKLAASDSIFVTFCAGETAGLSACQPTVVAPNEVRTVLDGPRSDTVDVITFWINRLGAPVRIRNIYGHETAVQYGDPRFPGLVTRAQAADGSVSGVVYDGRGNTVSLTDSSHTQWINWLLTYARTTYEWDPKWNLPTKITTPLGTLVQRAYHSANGNLDWVQDGRGISSRMKFHYYTTSSALGLLREVEYAGGARDSIGYDVKGNISLMRTPLRWFTYLEGDRIGRLTVSRAPISSNGWRHDSTFYDVRSLPQRVVSYGPAMNGAPAQRLTVRSYFDSEGRLDSLSRWASPDPSGIGVMTTRWTYDPAGRTRSEKSPDGQVDSTWYDGAGNVIRVRTRRGHEIYIRYDALNRLVRRELPPVTYAPWRAGAAAQNPDSSFSPPYGGLTIPGEVTTFEHDAMGRVVRASNPHSRIRRTYTPSGMLSTDSLWIRRWDYSAEHPYGIRHEYDLNGRVVNTFYPSQLVAGTTGRAMYEYDSLSGLPHYVRGLQSEQFRFTWNGRNELTQLTMPGAIIEYNDYNLDGWLVLRRVQNATPTSLIDRYPDPWIEHRKLVYDARGKVLADTNIYGTKDIQIPKYSGLGYLVNQLYRATGKTIYGHALSAAVWEALTPDPFGNLLATSDSFAVSAKSSGLSNTYGYTGSPLVHSSVFQPGTGRIVSQVMTGTGSGKFTTTFHYDSQGNTILASRHFLPYENMVGQRYDDRISYYDAAGVLRIAERRTHDHPGGIYGWDEALLCRNEERYRYDPLGRRVVVRNDRDCWNWNTQHKSGRKPVADLSVYRRTIWNGNQELIEIQRPVAGMQMPGLVGGVTVAMMESDTSKLVLPPRLQNYYSANFDVNPLYGRVAYTHGLGIDRPMSITRFAYADRNYQDGFEKDTTYVTWPTFTLVPHWNAHGKAQTGTFANGAANYRRTINGKVRTAEVAWPVEALAYGRLVPLTIPAWYGTLVDQKVDGVGTLYRRNRQYDPGTGRFTQEDPIGLAGGMNLYGYANGDPVNFSDPFGLCAMAGAAGSVAMGASLAAATGSEYTGRDAAIDAVAGAICVGALVRGVQVLRAARAARRMAAVRAAGRAGEEAAGIVKNTRRIPSATGSAAYRVPDELTSSTLTEVKNVGKLDLTDQIRDFAAYAKSEGLDFELVIRKTTELSKPLQQFIKDNNITIRFLR